MALEAVLDKVDGLPDLIKAEYTAGSDGKFYLAVNNFDRHTFATTLVANHQTEVAKSASALSELNKELATLKEEREGYLKGSIPKGDVDRLEASYKDKYAKREAELTAQINQLNGNLQTMLVDNVAQAMATKMFKSPELVLPHIKARLSADMVDGKAITRILDSSGKPSAATLEDLQKEFATNPIFTPILLANAASGSSGGSGSNSGGDGGSKGGSFDYTKATPKEIAAHIKATKGAA